MKLIILHGWTYQSETWQPLLGMLRERGIDFEFLKIPGLTDGTNPVWTLDNYVEWLKEKTAAYDKIILWGHSNGGRISLAFIGKYPEKVARLILEDSAGIPPRRLRRIRRDVFRTVAKLFHALARSEKLRNMVHRLVRAKDYREATPEMRKTMLNLVYADLTPILETIACPTLIVWGALDTLTPLQDGELMHEKIRGSRMVIFPDGRHSPHIMHPKEMASLVEKEIRA